MVRREVDGFLTPEGFPRHVMYLPFKKKKKEESENVCEGEGGKRRDEWTDEEEV